MNTPNWQEDFNDLEEMCDEDSDQIVAMYRRCIPPFINDLLKEHDTKLVDAVEGLKVINHRLKDDSDNFEQMIYAENRGHNTGLQDAVNIIKGV